MALETVSASSNLMPGAFAFLPARTHMNKLLAASLLTLTAQSASAQFVFHDSFSPAPSPLWRNERGAWAGDGDRYFATNPSNNPPTLTSLTYQHNDFEITVDISDVSDGGIWLHIDDLALNGVLLVTGGFGSTGTGLYWHIMTNGGYSPPINQVSGLFNQGDDIRVRVVAVGDHYDAYLNGSPTPATSLTVPSPKSGYAGLYDFNSAWQSFDSVTLIFPCLADFNSDNFVNGDDYDSFASMFESADLGADLNRDGFVNGDDYDLFASHFEEGC